MKSPRLLLLLPILLFATLISTPLAAQDVTCQPAVLFDTSDKPDTPPTLKDFDIEYPAALAKAGTQGYAIVAFTSPPNYLHVVGTDIKIEENVRDKIADDGLSKPGQFKGTAAPSYSWTAFIFNPDSAAVDIPNATVRLLKVAPICVAINQWNSLPKSEKVLRGSIAIDASGKPQQITLETKSASAQALLPDIEKSVAQWSFAPARANGQPVASVIKTTFISLPVPDTIDSIPSNFTPPRPIKQDQPVYPTAFKKQGFTATVVVAFVVGKKGSIEDVSVVKASSFSKSVKDSKIVEASNKAFSNAAMDCVKKWKFKPATLDGVPFALRTQQPIAFHLNN